MNEKLKKRILELIPSEDLKAKLRETGFCPTDPELLALACNYAPSFDARLELLRELEKEFAGEYGEYIKRLIPRQLSSLDEFKKPSPGTVFELHIKELPDSYDERYLCGSFEAALDLIPLFYAEYDSRENALSRYTVVKRRIYCGGDPFSEDELGEMLLLPGRMIHSVELWSSEFGAEDCDGLCHECGRPCARNCEIRFPCFLRQGEAVKWTDFSGKTSFGIVLQDGDAPQSEYYVIPLCREKLLPHDFETMHEAHRHIPAPIAERIEADELPERLRENYLACREFLKTTDYYGAKIADEE